MSLRPALAALTLLAACAGAPDWEDWRLQILDGAALQGGATMTLGPDGEVSGEGPCNLWRARNRAAPGGFVLGPIATTRRQCLAEGGETRFLAAMAAVTEAQREDGMLVLSGPGIRLVFAPA